MEYIFHIAILIGIYIILSVSLDLLVGQTGLLSIAHAAFFSFGAYSSALIAGNSIGGVMGGIVVGFIVSIFLSLFLSVPSLRLHDDYFAIATFGFQMVIFSILNNWSSVTRGPLGISGINLPEIMGYSVRSPGYYIVIVILFSVLSYIAYASVIYSPFGRVLRAIREDEFLSKSLGKKVLYSKVAVFGLSGVLASCAGSIYAFYMTYIDPSSFNVLESILILSMVIVGGPGSLWGPLIGASILLLIPELLSSLNISNASVANLRRIIYGVMLIVMMMVRPRGLIGEYEVGK